MLTADRWAGRRGGAARGLSESTSKFHELQVSRSMVAISCEGYRDVHGPCR